MTDPKEQRHRHKCNSCHGENKVEEMFFIDVPVGRMWLCVDPFKKCAENLADMVIKAAQSAREAFKIEDEVKRLAIGRRMHE